MSGSVPGVPRADAILPRVSRDNAPLPRVRRGLPQSRSQDHVSNGTPPGWRSLAVAVWSLLKTLPGAVAEFERALIRERVVSGLARAAREGRRGGNPAMRARDPDALRRLWHAREDAYLAQV